MTIQTTEDGEYVQQSAPLTLFGTDDPVGVVERATAVATALADVLKRRQLVKRFGGNEYVLLEGWTLLGSMLGVFAQVEWTRPIEDGWEARALVKTRTGDTVGSAEAMCTKRERKWSTQDDYAVRSMAQTRALAKALRMPLGFIVELAGYAATPAEEMPGDSEAGLPDIPPQPKPGRIGMGELRQRVLDIGEEHALPTEVLVEVIDSVFEGRTLGDLSKDELIQFGTDIKQGKYDIPTEPTPDEPATPAGSSADRAMTPGSDTLQEVLDLTDGELVDQTTGTVTPTKDDAEAAQKAAARAARVTP